MAIYVTGDTHGYQDRFFDEDRNVVPAVKKLTGADVLIVAGDFGYLFTGGPKELEFLDKLETLPFTLAFVDGNHENFPLIYSFPETAWCGGRVHQIRQNIFHLMRGEIFDIQGKTIFVMGGAASVDKYMRQEGLSWWYQELPTEAEYQNASRNLAERGEQVQYIITHTAPTYIIQAMGYKPSIFAQDGQLCGFLEWVAKDSPAKNYHQWLFGHWHTDMESLSDVHRKNLESQRFRSLNFDMAELD
jgi:predicted phosphodiesterase